jgi:hydroxyacylglutathione hydrolase
VSGLEVLQLPIWADNYAYLLIDPPSGTCALVDAPEAGPVLQALEARGLRLQAVWNTHHHPDHVGANLELAARTGAEICGPAADAARIPGITRGLREGDRLHLGDHEVEVWETPAHTRGHLTLWAAAEGWLFPGDTLFLGGAGRLFEGTPAQLLAAMDRFAALPGEARVACAHEYTVANLRFAAALLPGDAAIAAALRAAEARRAEGRPTVPGSIGEEIRYNPYLRSDEAEIARALGVQPGDRVGVIAALRARKDAWRG